MTLVDILNDVHARLNATTPTHIGHYAKRDSSGRLDLPDENAQYVIWLITSVPTYDWGKLKDKDARVQIDAYAKHAGEALTIAEATEGVLLHDYIPLPLKDMGQDRGYVRFSQDYTKGYA